MPGVVHERDVLHFLRSMAGYLSGPGDALSLSSEQFPGLMECRIYQKVETLSYFDVYH